jgi:hypothetical protein
MLAMHIGSRRINRASLLGVLLCYPCGHRAYVVLQDNGQPASHTCRSRCPVAVITAATDVRKPLLDSWGPVSLHPVGAVSATPGRHL